MNYDQSEEELTSKARLFLLGIMEYYSGTNVDKLERAEEFIDSLLFKTSVQIQHPFSNDSRNAYDLAYVSKYVIIPMIKKRLEMKENSDPFSIHKWD